MTDENCKEDAEIPVYVCHKEVLALKIKSVDFSAINSTTLSFVDGSYDDILINNISMENKPTPSANMYYVVYADNYFSFSPEKQFEEGYTLKSN